MNDKNVDLHADLYDQKSSEEKGFIELIKHLVASTSSQTSKDNTMILENIYVMCDDFEAEQKHIEVIFMFKDENIDTLFKYSLTFHTGMPLKEFKKFIQSIGKKMDTTPPELCKGE